METLDEIGLRHKTDKSTMTHHYLGVYESYLKDWRDKEFTLIELGIAAGNSLKMWHQAFPKAKIIGIDINPDCAGYCEPPIEVYIGSQTDTVFLDSVLAKIGVPDVIIDDGSHVGADMIFSFRHLFPKMKAGGFYVVEDTHAGAYIPTYAGEMESNGRSKAFNFFTGLVYDVDVAGRGSCGNAEFCINHPSETPAVPEFSRILECAFFHCSLWWFKRR
mgnify:CR=1 FL=1